MRGRQACRSKTIRQVRQAGRQAKPEQAGANRQECGCGRKTCRHWQATRKQASVHMQKGRQPSSLVERAGRAKQASTARLAGRPSSPTFALLLSTARVMSALIQMAEHFCRVGRQAGRQAVRRSQSAGGRQTSGALTCPPVHPTQHHRHAVIQQDRCAQL